MCNKRQQLILSLNELFSKTKSQKKKVARRPFLTINISCHIPLVARCSSLMLKT